MTKANPERKRPTRVKPPPAADPEVYEFRKVRPTPVEATRFIMEAAISHNATVVLIAINAHANNKTGWCYPSMATICDFTKLGRTTVWETVHQCVTDGYLHTTAPKHRQPLSYVILWHQLPYRKKARVTKRAELTTEP